MRGIDEYWENLLASFPDLAVLRVEGGDARSLPPILPLLGTRRAGGGYLCPRLAELYIFWDCYHDRIHWPTEDWSHIDKSPPRGSGAARANEGERRWPYGSVETRLYCGMLEECFRSRSEQLPILELLTVSIWGPRETRGRYGLGHQAAPVEALLRQGLGDLVKQICVTYR